MEANTKYHELRKRVDALGDSLEEKHQKHMACRAGCDLCCMDYSIFPLEFFSILEALKSNNYPVSDTSVKEDGSCVFLKDHKCTIYNERPIICRTHGLPLLFANEEGEWELSACELNFKEFSLDNFTNENTFPQDRFNSELFMLNKKFIEYFEDEKFDAFDLLPLRYLLHYLNNK